MAKIYRGWIHGDQKDAEALTSIGIKLGSWNSEIQGWPTCDVPAESMEKLDRLWGQFIWGLDLVEV